MTKSVLITGASSGIGRATASLLAEQGHAVFATARRLDKLTELAAESSGDIVPVQLDVRDAASIRAAAATVAIHAPDGLDVLVNNAGYSLIGAVETLSAKDIRDQYDTNVLGLIDVTRTFLPQMRARRSGRIVNVSSVLGRMSIAGSGVYSSTKFAVEALSDALRLELRPFGVDVVIVEPGFTATDIDTAPRSTDLADEDYRPLTTALAAYTARETAGGADPRTVAATVVKAVTTTRPKARYVTPAQMSYVIRTLSMMPAPVADSLKMRQLSGS